jgi:hypothetical protein
MFTLLSILSTSAFADTQVLSDIGRIASSSEVQNFIEQNKLQVESISYYPMAACMGELSSYSLKAKSENGQSCEVWVMAGYCADGAFQMHHEKITLLTTKSDMKCQ